MTGCLTVKIKDGARHEFSQLLLHNCMNIFMSLWPPKNDAIKKDRKDESRRPLFKGHIQMHM